MCSRWETPSFFRAPLSTGKLTDGAVIVERWDSQPFGWGGGLRLRRLPSRSPLGEHTQGNLRSLGGLCCGHFRPRRDEGSTLRPGNYLDQNSFLVQANARRIRATITPIRQWRRSAMVMRSTEIDANIRRVRSPGCP